MALFRRSAAPKAEGRRCPAVGYAIRSQARSRNSLVCDDSCISIHAFHIPSQHEVAAALGAAAGKRTALHEPEYLTVAAARSHRSLSERHPLVAFSTWRHANLLKGRLRSGKYVYAIMLGIAIF